MVCSTKWSLTHMLVSSWDIDIYQCCIVIKIYISVILSYRVFPRGSRFPALPCISFSNYVFFYLRPLGTHPQVIPSPPNLRIRWTIIVRRHLIDNMPKTCACVGCTNHNMMGQDISFYKFRDKTPNNSTGSGGGCNLWRELIRMEQRARGHLGTLPKS